MTNNSQFTLRWDMDETTLSYVKAESQVLNMGGYRWTAAFDHDSINVDFTLRCDADQDGPFKCEVKVDMQTYVYGEECRPSFSKVNLKFDGDNTIHLIGGSFWSDFSYPVLRYGKSMSVHFHINIISSERGKRIVDATKFMTSNSMSNVILSIEDTKLHVSKEYLAVHSPEFKTLFFGELAEKGKEEVEIKDVVYEEFVDLLHVIYVQDVQITDFSVLHLLKLADQYHMECVLNLSKKHLMQTKGIDAVKKLLLADKYRLTELRETVLKSFTSVADIVSKIKSAPEYDDFSEGMRAAICDRIMKI